MANNITLKGQLNLNDRFADSALVGGAAGDTRLDEYMVTVDQPGSSLTLTLDPVTATYDGFIALIDPKTGQQLAFDNTGAAGLDDQILSFALPAGDTQFKVVVASNGAIVPPADYNLTAQVDNGNVALTSLNPATSGSQPAQTGIATIVSGQLTANDFFAPPVAGNYSLADEFRVVPTLGGNLTVGITGVPAGFTNPPRLELIDATTGTLVAANVGPAAALPATLLNVGTEYRVRLLSSGNLGTNTPASYQLAFNAPNGVSVTPVSTSQGSGTVSINTPTLAPDPAAIAPDTTQYLRFNKGTQGSVEVPDATKPVNTFDLIQLSTGDDVINLNTPPNPPFTALTPAINADSTTNFEGARWVVASGGNDSFVGTAGNDVPIVGNAGNDTFTMGDGADVAVGGRDSDKLNGDAGNDILNGNAGNDRVDGGDGNDTLNGGRDNDIIIGGLGNDLMSGDAGQDFLTGGGGADTFVLTNNANNTAATANLADVITDFNVADADKIQLVGAGFADLTFESIDLAVDGGGATAATAIKLAASGQYLGIVQNVSPFALANSSLFVV
ncbi:MAG: calcium-binding protein [Geitlerinemataceae cyanobacterium]